MYLSNQTELPWDEARREFDDVVLPKLKEIGLTVGLDAQRGNEKAQRVIQYYSLLYKSFDPLMLICLTEAIKEYESK